MLGTNVFRSVAVVVMKGLIYIGEDVGDDLEKFEYATGYFLTCAGWDGSLLRNLTAFLTSLIK